MSSAALPIFLNPREIRVRTSGLTRLWQYGVKSSLSNLAHYCAPRSREMGKKNNMFFFFEVAKPAGVRLLIGTAD